LEAAYPVFIKSLAKLFRKRYSNVSRHFIQEVKNADENGYFEKSIKKD
jgi:hypothetical protein